MKSEHMMTQYIIGNPKYSKRLFLIHHNNIKNIEIQGHFSIPTTQNKNLCQYFL